MKQPESEYRKWFKSYLDEHTQIGDLLVMAMDINRVESLLATELSFVCGSFSSYLARKKVMINTQLIIS